MELNLKKDLNIAVKLLEILCIYSLENKIDRISLMIYGNIALRKIIGWKLLSKILQAKELHYKPVLDIMMKFISSEVNVKVITITI
jgi:hypothetical protein